MDHAEARDALELAAVEPGGIERLEAGDSPTAATLAGHLVECRSCAAEWERLRRTSAVLRAALGGRPAPAATAVRVATAPADREGQDEAPPPELRDRTLRFVREVGRQRGVEPLGLEPPVVAFAPLLDAPVPLVDASAPAAAADRVVPASRLAALRRRRRILGELAGIAAALALIVGLSAFAIVRDGQVRDAQHATSAVSEIAAAQARLASAPDVLVVRLTAAPGTGGTSATGTLLMSPSTTESVMFATGLTAPPAGETYRCWVDTAQGHKVLGDLHVEGGVAYWWDWVKVPGLSPGARFGVSLVPSTGSGGSSAPLLTGTLGS